MGPVLSTDTDGQAAPARETDPMKRSPRTTAALLVAVLATVAPAGGCTLKEAICRGGEYPVKAVGNTTGRMCVADGQQPPAGFVRYPAGKVPKYVDDQWDKYWRDKIVDEHGAIMNG
jgi:hypothetical protein